MTKNNERKTNRSGSLSEALGLKTREMISLTGAGGKTTLMFHLAHELKAQGRKVLTTTTTKILEPTEDESAYLFVSENETELHTFLDEHLGHYGQITVAKERIGGGKLKGISPELADRLWEKENIDFLIIEADGSAGRPVKAPRNGEPVIPSKTTLVVGVLGLDGIGKELNDQYVFQPNLVSLLTGIPEGEQMTEEGMALLMNHPEGLFKGAPERARRIAFLNKADVSDGLTKGRTTARMIFEREHSLIERVVLGQLKEAQAWVEVVFP